MQVLNADCPDVLISKFTPDGKYLVGLSLQRNIHQKFKQLSTATRAVPHLISVSAGLFLTAAASSALI